MILCYNCTNNILEKHPRQRWYFQTKHFSNNNLVWEDNLNLHLVFFWAWCDRNLSRQQKLHHSFQQTNKKRLPAALQSSQYPQPTLWKICTTARDGRLVWQHRTWVRSGIAAGGTALCQNQFHCHCCIVWGREVAKLAGHELSAAARTLRVEDLLPVPDLTRTNYKLSWHLLSSHLPLVGSWLTITGEVRHESTSRSPLVKAF